MNIANIYRKLKQILNDSNKALVDRGLNEVNSLNEIPSELKKLGEINNLPFYLRKETIEITENDLMDVASIKFDTFQHYKNFKSITIPNSVTVIGVSAFEYCTSLTNVTIPNSVIRIERSAFRYCTSLKDMYMHRTTPPILNNNNAIPLTTTIHVPIGSGEAYKTATNWSYHATRIVEDIVTE